NSGVIEEFKSKGVVFTDNDILDIFKDFKRIRTKRLLEVPNTWCVWGENDNPDQKEFGPLSSEIVEDDVYSILVFVHDTEIDPSWMLTDNIIYNSYENFKNDIVSFIDEFAAEILNEAQQSKKENNQENNSLFLITLGTTEDKKVIFELDPHKQKSEFWEDKNFQNFAWKVREYFYKKQNGEIKDEVIKSFKVFEDNKLRVIIKDPYVKTFIDKIIKFYEKREKYEFCKQIKDEYDSWVNMRKNSKK
ncbi:MAG: hypothetical protein ACOC1K_00565, partial [Nanoarchaeota archaeon]